MSLHRITYITTIAALWAFVNVYEITEILVNTDINCKLHFISEFSDVDSQV